MRLVIHKYIVLVLVVFFISCSKGGVTPEEAVYETLFLKIHGNTFDKSYIVDKTDSSWFKKNKISEILERNSIAKIDERLIEQLYMVNEKSVDIIWTPIMVELEKIPFYIHVSENDQIRCGMKSNGTVRGYHTVSKVAFSASGEFAIVKHGYHCAPMSGAGESLVVFRKVGKQWVVFNGLRLWIS